MIKSVSSQGNQTDSQSFRPSCPLWKLKQHCPFNVILTYYVINADNDDDDKYDPFVISRFTLCQNSKIQWFQNTIGKRSLYLSNQRSNTIVNKNQCLKKKRSKYKIDGDGHTDFSDLSFVVSCLISSLFHSFFFSSIFADKFLLQKVKLWRLERRKEEEEEEQLFFSFCFKFFGFEFLVKMTTFLFSAAERILSSRD